MLFMFMAWFMPWFNKLKNTVYGFYIEESGL